MTEFPISLTHPKVGCEGCQNSAELDFDFAFAYQPIVDLRDCSVFAHEALVRGIHGEGAMSILSQVNEQNRYRFDQRCRTEAIAGAARLKMREHLSINFLPNAVYRPELCIRSTLEAAKTHNFPLSQLIFETVESEYLDNNRHLTNILREYHEFGFKTAIDDFGAGYSGLTLLADFQPDLIKLDMALIRDIHLDRPRQAIVRGVVTMCAELGVTVIAEGIEHVEERDFLSDCGIFLMQGYLFAKPAFKALAQINPGAWQAV
ncbi:MULTISPECIES: EAL domain-containing protein [unclassified Pseudomonas]|uniref:S6 modification regulatory phosphodiesterase RimA n=1 Tax=unclassified Pseudomonas TaxID=196821 RepID=UPI002AC8AACC|nr:MULTISPECIES: EAL domain-containing protein [unclassified Pseudomonas]MEB0040313.1 EAL domain-containing protein [Pseudomonas sp. MH10]MEB0077400.1 EAL domain-containing protein [Pseudomonas sp. MH10out]MEB0101145.1 EAL domain-containing protein [Pseudomonas sp. CCI3.2]MEB0130003.1 EAL domain-containing protein [Pseudomonas sp. CCI2.4]MEB0157245.1 EAL domain-containing protein [Pseudomonas sp. AH2 (2023)]